MKIKNVLYWCSIVAPLWDVFFGICKAISEIPDDVRKIHANRLYLKQISDFMYERSFSDMSEEEFEKKYKEVNERK